MAVETAHAARSHLFRLVPVSAAVSGAGGQGAAHGERNRG